MREVILERMIRETEEFLERELNLPAPLPMFDEDEDALYITMSAAELLRQPTGT